MICAYCGEDVFDELAESENMYEIVNCPYCLNKIYIDYDLQEMEDGDAWAIWTTKKPHEYLT